jgi:hypothetical protein
VKFDVHAEINMETLTTSSTELLQPGPADVEYVVSEDLNDLADADVQLNTLLERLDSKEWLVVCEALNHTRQLSIFHTHLLVPILDTVVALVIKSVKNPRSALCKTALMTSTDMFMAYQDQLLDLLDPLLLQLLLKASQDKRFVCEEAERTLRGMTTSISPQPMLQKLQPYVNHRNPRVRAKAAMCMYNSVSRLVCPFGLLAHILCCQSKMSNPTGLFHGLSTFQQVF